ncbi:hypothetical protein ACFSTI_19830 [Rhizorhabdus histidinilytica]
MARIVADVRRRQAEAEQAAANRLLPSNRFTDALGKAYAAPLTFAGGVAGLANVAAARLAGDKRAGISVRDNGIQFESGYLGEKDRAFTLGNAVLHGPGSRPEDPVGRSYDRQPTQANTAEHESGHTYQYQKFGFVPLYLLSALYGALNGTPNPYEREADDFANWVHRQRRSQR